MSDDLIVSGGGRTSVSGAAMMAFTVQLHAVVDDLRHSLTRLAAIDRGLTLAQLRDADAPYSAVEAERMIDEAAAALRSAALRAHLLASGLEASAEAYGTVERTVQQLGQVVAAKLAYALGFVFPALAVVFGPMLASSALAGAAAYALLPEGRRAAVRRWLADQNDVLTSPQAVALARLAVMSADDFGGGLARVSPHLVELLGDEGLQLVGLTTAAGVLASTAGPLGPLSETPVRVRRVSTRADQGQATTFAERARRIPQGHAQVRIDRIHTGGGPDRFEVYIGGTRDFALTPASEPWDMTSNVNALSMGDSGSYRAVSEAMRLAGVDSTTPVQFVGHSQGGLVAAALASSGDYTVHGMFTVGGVVSQPLVPEGVPWLAIEHTDDLVPALGGNRIAPDAVLVRRQVFGATPVPSDSLLPAHELTRYRATAAIVDRSADGRSGAVLEQLNRLGDSAASVTTTRYYATRLPG